MPENNQKIGVRTQRYELKRHIQLEGLQTGLGENTPTRNALTNSLRDWYNQDIQYPPIDEMNNVQGTRNIIHLVNIYLQSLTTHGINS